MSRGRGPGRRLAAALVACLLLGAVAGCGDEASDEPSDDPGVANPPEKELAALIGDQGALRHRLPTADAVRFTNVILAARGLDDAARSCAAPAVGSVLEPDAEGNVSVARFGRLVRRLADPGADLAKVVDGCLSDETRQRIAEERSADDLDLTGFLELAHRVGAGQAEAIGMTPEEAECYADRSLEGVEPEKFARAVVGFEDSQGADPVGAIEACLDRKRLSELVVAGRAMKAEYEECLRERAEQQVDALNEALSTSSTSVPATSPSTVDPCV